MNNATVSPYSHSAAGAPTTDSALLTVSGALALVILLMVALVWLFRRSRMGRRFHDSRQLLQVVASQSLGARERVIVLDVEDRRLVLGVTATHITQLATLEKRADAAPEETPADFSSLLGKLRQKYRKEEAS